MQLAVDMAIPGRQLTNRQPNDALDYFPKLPSSHGHGVGLRLQILHLLEKHQEKGDGSGVIQQGLPFQQY